MSSNYSVIQYVPNPIQCWGKQLMLKPQQCKFEERLTAELTRRHLLLMIAVV